MIESKDNEKLKLVRKLHVRKHRERQGLFATEGAQAGVDIAVDHALVAVAVTDEPDLGHAFDPDQIRGLQGAHRPGDFLCAGLHG